MIQTQVERPLVVESDSYRGQVIGLARSIAADPWAGLEDRAQIEVRATLIGELKQAIRRMDTAECYVLTVHKETD